MSSTAAKPGTSLTGAVGVLAAPSASDARSEGLTRSARRRRVAALRSWVPANVRHTQVVLTFAAGWARGSDTAVQTLIGLGEALCAAYDEYELLAAAGPVADPLVRLGAMVRGEVQRRLYSELVAVVRARH